jgi:peptide methionine sulfoxide reductase MsrA
VHRSAVANEAPHLIYLCSQGRDRRQRKVAEETISDVERLGPSKVMTEVSESGPFWEAEAQDQGYGNCHPRDRGLAQIVSLI